MDISQRAQLARESRAFTVEDIEIRAEGDTITFDGVASLVDTPYQVHDMFGDFTETMSRGAFSKTLKEKADVRFLVNHEGVPLARTKSKTLSLTADPHLRAYAPSLDPMNPTVQEIRSAMSRGDLDQMSIGFQVTRQEWNGDYTQRTIKEVKLFDVSVVTFPASPTTSASVRSLDEFISSIGSDVDPDEIRRAINHLESLLPQEETRAVDPESFARVLKMWDLRLNA